MITETLYTVVTIVLIGVIEFHYENTGSARFQYMASEIMYSFEVVAQIGVA